MSSAQSSLLSPSKLMTIINSSFFSLGLSNNVNINDIVKQHIDELNVTHICAIFHKACKNNLYLNFIPLCERLKILINNDDCNPNCQNISNIVYGIRNFKNVDAEELSILLITVIQVCNRCFESKPTSQNFGNSLLGKLDYLIDNNHYHNHDRDQWLVFKRCECTSTD